jgi:hypothetical protein
VIGAVAVAACVSSSDDRVLGIDATGFVGGLVYWDLNGNREFDQADQRLEGVLVTLLVSEAGGAVAGAVSDPAGEFRMRDVPVGRYHVAVDSSTFADTARVVQIDTSVVELSPSDSASVVVTVSVPIVTVAEARSLPVGESVFVVGIALMRSGDFGDSTVHVSDTSGALRVTRIRAPILFPGDSARFGGTISARDGQPTLDEASPFIILFGPPPEPLAVASATAATADNGQLDADLVEVVDAVVSDTGTVDTDFVITVDDGTGPLEVILDGNIPFDLEAVVPDTVVSVTGLLVPSGVGTWALKPRFQLDLEVP